jgi:hypothetical protein
METLHRLAAFDSGFIIATPFLEIDVTDNAALEQASLVGGIDLEGR